jgi:hypothetical protein
MLTIHDPTMILKIATALCLKIGIFGVDAF